MVKQREWGRVSVKDTFYFKIRRSVERRKRCTCKFSSGEGVEDKVKH